MTRILPDDVLAAREATGLRVVRGSYCERDPSGRCCVCALTAVAVHRGAVTLEEAMAEEDDHEYLLSLLCLNLDLDEHYGSGFVDGFDDAAKGVFVRPYGIGYADGQACAAAVFGEQTTTGGR
jgi:hypothetical protein